MRPRNDSGGRWLLRLSVLLCHCEERSDVAIRTPYGRQYVDESTKGERIATAAQPLATKELYGCGVPLAGSAGSL